jgi:transcriptional regulator with XRE-family HTH domain
MTKEDIGAEIKARRIQLQLTQKALADKLNMNVQHIPNIEKGVTNLTIKSLIAICEALNMEIRINPIGVYLSNPVATIKNEPAIKKPAPVKKEAEPTKAELWAQMKKGAIE